MKTVDTIQVGWDYKPDKDNAILIVGRKRSNESVKIINAFEGDEAKSLYEKLTGEKGD